MKNSVLASLFLTLIFIITVYTINIEDNKMDEKNYIIHREEDRGHSNYGWLDSHFSFSFADWYEPSRMGFGLLRVLNDDIVSESHGFGTHPHRDMEIVSIPTHGELKHKDTLGNDAIIKSGEVQRMSAGTGILHSEYNNKDDDKVKFFQIWIETRKKGIEPSYDQKAFDKSQRKNKIQLVVSPDGKENSVSINQDAYFSLVDLDENNMIVYQKHQKENGIYVYNIEGNIEIKSENLNRRDAIGITNEDDIEIKSKNKLSKLLIIEVPMEQ